MAYPAKATLPSGGFVGGVLVCAVLYTHAKTNAVDTSYVAILFFVIAAVRKPPHANRRTLVLAGAEHAGWKEHASWRP